MEDNRVTAKPSEIYILDCASGLPMVAPRWLTMLHAAFQEAYSLVSERYGGDSAYLSFAKFYRVDTDVFVTWADNRTVGFHLYEFALLRRPEEALKWTLVKHMTDFMELKGVTG